MPTPHDHLIANLADAIAGEDEHATDWAIAQLEAAVGAEEAGKVIDQLLAEHDVAHPPTPLETPPPLPHYYGPVIAVKCA